MAVVVVGFGGRDGAGFRLTSADANSNFGNWGGGGGTPAAEAQLRYQGTAAVNKKVTTTGATPPSVGIDYDPAGAVGTRDHTVPRWRLWLAKVYVADFGDLNTTYGVKIALGSSNANYYEYNVAGSGANRTVYTTYPAQGGYLLVPLDARLAAYWENTVGTPDLTAVDWFGVQALFVAGGAKSENLAIDAIDVGSGLAGFGGDGVSTDGTYENFSDADQGATSSRWGFAVSSGPGSVELRGFVIIGANTAGTAVATEFTDAATAVVFPDGYFVGGDAGVIYDLGNASTIIVDSAPMTGQGAIDTDADTRPDLITLGTNGDLNMNGKTLRSLRRIQLTNSASAENMDVIESGQVDPTNGDYGGYQTLDGTGDYLDTSAAVSHTFANGDFTLVARVAPTDWTPAANSVVFDWVESGADGISLQVLTGGTLRLSVSVAAASTLLTSSVAVPAADGQWMWVRVDYDASAGTADFFYSHEAENAVPQDMVWTALGTQQTGTGRTIVNLNTVAAVGGTSLTGTSLLTGDVSYASIWDGLAFGHLQVLLADWRWGPDFTGTPAARADGIQSVNWEENGDPVYTLGGNVSTAADLDGATIDKSTSYAGLRWAVNTDPNGELDNMTFDLDGGHAIEFGKESPAAVTLTGHTYLNANVANGNVDSTFYNNTGGALTINLTNASGNTTYRNGVGASTTIVQSVTVTITVTDTRGDPIQGAKVRVEEDEAKPRTLVDDGTTNASGVFTFSYSGTTPQAVRVVVRLKGYIPPPVVATNITASGLDLPVTMNDDPTVNMP